ncbi:MAG: PKD domain-containing protein [Cyclobacteriaceae bacterium]|nr:PKD domain-containing protein [Cyclobacteriaceae bacterium]
MSEKSLLNALLISIVLCAGTALSGMAQPLTADAGPSSAQVCEGDGLVLGGDPSAYGGTGFYSISWTSNPPGFTSQASNPVVTPDEDTDYILTVMDSNGDIDIDVISVTIKPRTDPSDLDIVFNPDANSYSVESGPVDLSFTVGGGGAGSGVLSGTGVNSTTNQFHPSAANIGTNDITLTFTNTDGCVTEITETISVYNPNGFISGLDNSYCPYGDDDLTINVPPPYLSFVDVFMYDENGIAIPVGTSWTKNVAARTVHLNLDLLPLGKNRFSIVYNILGITGYNYTPYLDVTCLCIRYNITPIIGPVQTVVEVPMIINPQPEVKIAFKSEVPALCRNATPLTLEGAPAGGIWQGMALTPAPGNDASPEFSSGDNGLASFDPSSANIGTNPIRYIYEDGNGCRDTTRVDMTVYDLPVLDFTAPDGCVGIPVEFDPSVTLPAGVTVTGYVWDFDDDRREAHIVLPDPTTHVFTSSNDYDITLGATTADGCFTSVTHQISVGDIPDVKLGWSSVCDGDPTRFAFKSSFFNTTPSDVYRVSWDFGDGVTASRINPPLSDTVRNYTYAGPGTFQAHVTLETDLGCTNSDTVVLYKVPRTGIINGDNEYLQDFDAATLDDQQWVSGGSNSSWEWGVPAKTLINDDASGGGKAWVTSLNGSFNINEDSWVHSPCIDLSEIDRPVLSLDIRSLTRSRIEGAVLQVNVTGSTDKESDWKTIGGVGTGVNWYNATGILSNPGNQSLNQTGWSGSLDSTAWRKAVISLDNTLAPLSPAQRSRMRFRIAFSSPVDSSFSATEEGFAFDNFRIGQRDRIVLLESFTNAGGPNTPDEPNKSANTLINTFADGLVGELVKVEYHVGLGGPGDDPLYEDNPVDANARAAYYGITFTPFALVDGRLGSNLMQSFSNQSLRPAEAAIDTIITSGSAGSPLNIDVQFTAETDLPPRTSLHVVVIEKIITAPTGISNGESEFKYVMKKMLPTARGTVFASGVPAGETRTVSVSWLPRAYDPSNLAVIAFLQHEETGEIFQTRLLDAPQYLPTGVVTGIEPTLADRVRIYPVPANNELNVTMPGPLRHPVVCRLFDAVGQVVATEVYPIGEKTRAFDTGSLADGVYILQFETPGEPISRKKVMVVHSAPLR